MVVADISEAHMFDLYDRYLVNRYLSQQFQFFRGCLLPGSCVICRSQNRLIEGEPGNCIELEQ